MLRLLHPKEHDSLLIDPTNRLVILPIASLILAPKLYRKALASKPYNLRHTPNYSPFHLRNEAFFLRMSRYSLKGSLHTPFIVSLSPLHFSSLQYNWNTSKKLICNSYTKKGVLFSFSIIKVSFSSVGFVHLRQISNVFKFNSIRHWSVTFLCHLFPFLHYRNISSAKIQLCEKVIVQLYCYQKHPAWSTAKRCWKEWQGQPSNVSSCWSWGLIGVMIKKEFNIDSLVV